LGRRCSNRCNMLVKSAGGRVISGFMPTDVTTDQCSAGSLAARGASKTYFWRRCDKYSAQSKVPASFWLAIDCGAGFVKTISLSRKPLPGRRNSRSFSRSSGGDAWDPFSWYSPGPRRAASSYSARAATRLLPRFKDALKGSVAGNRVHSIIVSQNANRAMPQLQRNRSDVRFGSRLAHHPHHLQVRG